MLLSLLLACGRDPAPKPAAGPPPDVVSRFAPANVVVMVVVDSLARHMLSGFHPDWDTSPRLAAFLGEGASFPNTLAVRGVTSVAVSSLQTGAYPRTHGVRNNEDWPLPELPLIVSRFRDAGYYTVGLAANVCQFIDQDVDRRLCTWSQETPGLTHPARDELLIQEFEAALADRPPGQPLFVWLHLMSPHDPYVKIEPWYSEFHPASYEGSLDAEDPDALDQAMLGEIPFDEADLAHVRAVYASQVRAMDEKLGRALDALEAAGAAETAVVLFGADHGEGLGVHHDYLLHGCSPYNDVNAVAYAIRAPGRLPAGATLGGWVSQTDMGVTLADVAGIGWSGERDGVSLVGALLDGEAYERPVYMERGTDTAGVIEGQLKYIRDEDEGDTACPPYSYDHPYPGQLDALYDLAADPEEQEDLSAAQPDVMSALRGQLCEWVTEDVWEGEQADRGNPLVKGCEAAR